MPGKKRKAKEASTKIKAARKQSQKLSKNALAAVAKDRHAKKIERRKLSHKLMRAEDWAIPPPPGLNGKLAVPKLSSKYATYFEFADNHEKKKKLEYQVSVKISRAQLCSWFYRLRINTILRRDLHSYQSATL